jgi:hypothetical protein
MVDVIINVLGKPYSTALTLFSLMRHSGGHIDTIYMIIENAQILGTDYEDFRFIAERLGNVIGYVPQEFLFAHEADLSRMAEEGYRHSIHYQYGFEKSDKQLVFVTHNDVLYHGDAVGAMLEVMGEEYVGVGSIGQCWNCPAAFAGLCDGDRYADFRPTYEQLAELIEKFPPRRAPRHKLFVMPERPHPLPECRLNEYACLVDKAKVEHLIMPRGPVPPFGAYNEGIDSGCGWFRHLNWLGYRFKNMDLSQLLTHAWASETGGGFAALYSEEVYRKQEEMARGKLVELGFMAGG